MPFFSPLLIEFVESKVSGTFPGRRRALMLRILPPQRIILQCLLYLLFNLRGAQTGVGTGQFLSSLSHEGHGIKCLLLHVAPDISLFLPAQGLS